MFSEQQNVQTSLKGLKLQYYKCHQKSRQFHLEKQSPFALHDEQAISRYGALYKKDVEQAAYWNQSTSYQILWNKKKIM